MPSTIVEAITRGARRGFRSNVTLDGREVGGRLFPDSSRLNREIALVGGDTVGYERLYRTQVWIHTVVNKLARNIARLPLKVYVNPDEPTSRERVRTGPLAELLDFPGGRGVDRIRDLGPNRLKQEIVSNLAIHGNCVLVKQRPRDGAPPTALLPSSFSAWDVVRDASDLVWYVYTPRRGAPIPFRPDEVLHFKWWADGDGLKASSPLAALAHTLKLEDATQRHIINSFENGVRPAGAFSVEGQLKGPEVLQRMRAQLQEIYGGVDNAFKIAILEGGAKWQTMQHTLVESEALSLRKLTREEVAAAFDIPPPVIGILDRATFSNITEQHLMLYQDTIQPWTNMIEEVFAIQLIEDEPTMQGQYAEFDFGAVLAGDPVKQVDTLTKAVGGPFMTPNEARALRNLPPQPEPEADQLRPAPNASIVQGGTSGSGNG